MKPIKPKRGEFWVYKNYKAGTKGNIIELGEEVLEVLQNGVLSVEGKTTRNLFIYIDYVRLIKKITKEEYPEYFL